MNVTDKKAQLLKAMLKKKGIAAKGGKPNKISRLDRNEKTSFSLSFAQEQLWFQDQLFPDNPVYNIPVAICLHGDIEPDVLQESIRDVINRHESLRKNFIQTDKGPLAIINDASGFSLEQVESNSSELALVEIKNEVRLSFNLVTTPLIRAKLWTVSSTECYLLITIHHIVCDGWSVSILLDEIGQFYNSRHTDNSSDMRLDELEVDYVDFSQWQRDSQLNEKNVKQLEYWKQKLSGDLPILDLPADYTRPSVATFNGAMQKIQLSDESSAQLALYCKSHNITTFMFLLSMFNVLISRYTGAEDILVGTPVNNRSQKELENIIGYFVNTIVLRNDLSDNPLLSDFLLRVRNTVLEAFDNQDTPLGKLADELKIGRDLSQSTLFQVMFSLLNAPQKEIKIKSATVEQLSHDQLHTKTSKVDLNMVVEPRGESWDIWLEYNADIFSPETIDRLLSHYDNLINSALASADQKLSELNILSAKEKNLFLSEWNTPETNYVSDGLLHQYFINQVEKTPQRIALQYENISLTYAELDLRSNKLANYLLKYNTGPDVLVGLCLERGINLVVGILAILKTGSAYVPLDPTAPISRLEFIIDDAAMPIVLTEEKLFNIFSSNENSCDLLDINANEIDSCSDSAVFTDVSPENVAYVIYTSGSTGKPKGVLVEHRNVIRLFSATEEWYHFSENDVWTLFHSCTFDFSVWEIWGALFYGAKLVVVPYWVSRSAEEFHQFLVDEKVSVLNQTPSAFKQLSSIDQQINKPSELSLRYVIFGGEALDLESLRPWFSLHGDKTPQLINMYGITETTVHVTYRPITLDDVEAGNGSIIGKPIADLQTYLLDKYLNLVPIGVKGEIFVAGSGVTRGYLNRAELTEERFIENNISTHVNSKLYRSGDLARYLANGDMEYLGRIDDQVKIRGFRIELGEIETCLNSAPAIKQSIVMVQNDTSGNPCIVAYTIKHEHADGSVEELREYLCQHIPDYMIPQYFIEVAHFALTSNGKIDRKVLPLPTDIKQISATEYIAPRSETEKALAQIWSEVIGLEQIGIHDNFFNIGGHSLLATQVISRIKNHFEIELALRSLFDAGTISALSQQIDTAQNSSQGSSVAQIVIKKRPDDGPIELSFAQQRLWYLDQLDPQNPVYNIPIVYQLNGPLNRDHLTEALQRIYLRHQVLRTSFPLDNNEPVQKIDNTPLNIKAIELEQQHSLAHYITEEAATPFSLDQGPLIRVSLINQHVNDTPQHNLMIVVHHSLFDGWSTRVLMNELRELYRALNQGHDAQLPDLNIQYSDYAHWQREYLQGEVLEQQLEYWTDHLQGELPVLELPTDHPRPSHFSYVGKTYSAAVPDGLISALEKHAQTSGATVFMSAFAVYNTLLYRYTGQRDIITGTIIANRNQAQTENLLGYFANTLAIRTRIDASPSYNELLEQVRENCLNAYTHQDLPFERLVEALNPDRELSYTPIFQTLFGYNPLGDLEQPLDDIELTPLSVESQVARTDLSFCIEEKAQGQFHIEVEYCSDLFDEARIARLTEHYIKLLQSIVETPQAKLHELAMLSENEISTFEQWNQTAVNYKTETLLQQKFEQRAKHQPDHIALEFEGTQISYAELDQRATHCANYLISKGLTQGDYVGLFMLRSVEMLVGIYGILKAGGAYIPIDPDYPQERIDYIISDANIDIVLSHAAVTAEKLNVEQVIDMAQIDEEKKVAESSDKSTALARQNTCRAEDVAYVIYTSGTTGQPKGVMVSHKAIINRLEWMQQEYSLNDQDVVLQKTPYAFDVSVWELFWPLMIGARLCIAKPEGHKDPSYLKQLIKTQQVSTVHFVPSMLKVFLDMETLEDCKQLKRVYCSGEALPYDTLQQFLKDSDAELHNLYGPTEAAVDVSYWACIENAQKQVPIGVPVSNTQFYILDANLTRVPLGATGELFIAGTQLANGYLNKTELTDEKFLPNPYSPQPAKMYRTGDLVRYLNNGEIEYIGRTDFQVKIRGFRIELGEIETCLNNAPAIKQSIVMVQNDAAGSPCIVAYTINQEQADGSAEALREYLCQHIPDYMIPQYFIEVAHFALTSNGKIDRKALPLPTDVKQISATEYIAPRSETEKALAQIWSEVIGLEQIGIHDNFFNIGGHSLLATQVISRIKSHFEIELALRSLFDAGTIGALSQQIEAAQGSSAQQIVIEKRLDNGPIELSFAQQRLWYLDQLDPQNPVYNIPIVYSLSGPLNRDHLTEALQRIYLRHQVLRTSFPLDNNEPVQKIDNTPLNIKAVELEQQHSLAHYITEEAATPFSLDQGPLIRVSLIKQQTKDNTDNDIPPQHNLMIVVHHSLFDGWSTRVLMNELRELYRALNQGRDAQLPDLSIQYSDYAHWQREYLQGEVLEQQLEYWTDHLQGDLPVLELPTDHTRPGNFSFVGKTYSTAVPVGLISALEKHALSTGATVFMSAFAVYNTLLYRYTGQRDIITGTIIANRNQVQTENLLGYFANTLAIRTRIDANPSYNELLEQVRENCLNAYTHQDLPFERLVEALNPDRELSYTPIFQTLFGYNPLGDLEQPLDDIELTPLSVESHVARTDLSFAIEEKAQGQFNIEVEYCNDLFDEARIARLTEHYITLLQSIVETPQAKLHELAMLSENELSTFEQWNQTAVNYKTETLLQQKFEQRAKHQPDHIALEFEGTQISYGELDQRATHCANYLISKGVTQGDYVGLFMLRSIEMLVGIYGILKAGGAYIPIDPDYPQERVDYIIADANIHIVLSHAAVKSDELKVGQIIDMAQIVEAKNAARLTDKNTCRAEDVAYVIYTSGTTGQPKGVMVSHKAIINRLEWMQQEYSLNDQDVVLQKTPYAFDVSVWELFWPLMIGAKLCIAKPEGHKDPSYLKQLIKTQQVSTVHFVPSMLKVFLDMETLEDCKQLKRVYCSGEALPYDTLQQFLKDSDAELHNLYGPTEAAVDVSYWACIENAQKQVPIGVPVSNTQFYILDANLTRVPLGATGELFIAGTQLANGYLNKTELTDEKFLPNPYSPQPAKMYRTGDLVRYLNNGEIEYIGRTDFQVKIRGFRIELGEIETCLNNAPAIKQSIVMVQTDAAGSPCIVAYTIKHEQADNNASVTTLRKYLRAQLPDYMVPQYFVELESLPVTSNGKIDRKALPAPFNISAAGDNFVEPTTENEKILADIWKEVLSIDKISIHDNFFELGGHSLLSVQLVSKVKKRIGVDLELRSVVIDTLGQIAAQCPQTIKPDESNVTEQQLVDSSDSIFSRIKRKIKSAFVTSE